MLTLPAQSQDKNTIENLWRKIALEIVKRHPTIKRKLIESLTAAWNRGVTHVIRPPRQAVHSIQTLCSKAIMSKVGPKYTNPSSKRKIGLLKMEKRRLLFT